MAVTSPGITDYHLASQSGNLSINALSPVTLMCWLNATWNGGSRISMVGTYPSATSGGTGIQIGTGSGVGELSIWTWGGTFLVQSVGGTPATLSNNIWYHIGYTFDGTTHRLYVNGQLCNTGTTPQQAGTITSIYLNGFPTGGANETGAFSVDDVSYFNRTLSADEVLTAYTTAGDRDGLRFGCVASILFDEGATNSVANNCLDYTGRGNTLTPIGFSTGVNFVYSASYIAGNTRPVL